jgi:hypothetical protein
VTGDGLHLDVTYPSTHGGGTSDHEEQEAAASASMPEVVRRIPHEGDVSVREI